MILYIKYVLRRESLYNLQIFPLIRNVPKNCLPLIWNVRYNNAQKGDNYEPIFIYKIFIS